MREMYLKQTRFKVLVDNLLKAKKEYKNSKKQKSHNIVIKID